MAKERKLVNCLRLPRQRRQCNFRSFLTISLSDGDKVALWKIITQYIAKIHNQIKSRRNYVDVASTDARNRAKVHFSLRTPLDFIPLLLPDAFSFICACLSLPVHE